MSIIVILLLLNDESIPFSRSLHYLKTSLDSWEANEISNICFIYVLNMWQLLEIQNHQYFIRENWWLLIIFIECCFQYKSISYPLILNLWSIHSTEGTSMDVVYEAPTIFTNFPQDVWCAHSKFKDLLSRQKYNQSVTKAA